MAVDYKVATHICNVVRRQIQSSFPDLYIHFVVHGENARAKSYSRDIHAIQDHDAGRTITQYFNHDNDAKNLLTKNKSCFACLGKYYNPGFLGFFHKKSYVALCFINHDRFSDENNLRNHAYHLVWHALAIYNSVNLDQKPETVSFFQNGNIAVSNFVGDQVQHQNLMADIFAVSVQYFQGKKDVLDAFVKQRMLNSITPEIGFIAEDFPFPICLDTLEFHLGQERYQKVKKQVKTAITLTEEIGKTYDLTTTEQWKSFSVPAQEMAWLGFSPETILGAALYTGENTYAQSIGDLIAERLNIKPEFVTNIEDFNPFTSSGVNERLHTKLCKNIIDGIITRIHSKEDIILFLDIAKKQNLKLKEGGVMGWCVPSLLRAREILHQCATNDSIPLALKEMENVFLEDIKLIHWDTLAHFSKKIIYTKRNGDLINEEIIEDITQSSDEFTTIGYALSLLKEIIKADEYTNGSFDGTKKRNIGDFMGPNALKK